MSFYIGALFNQFRLLHRCCPHLRNFPLFLLLNVVFQDLMVVIPLLIRAEEGMVAGETLEVTSMSLVVRLFMEIVAVLLGSKIVAMVAIGSSTDQQPQISGHDRSDVSFVTRLVIQHSSVHILFIMGINPRPPSPLVILQQQILSLGFLTQV
jgi:hypothetical protein